MKNKNSSDITSDNISLNEGSGGLEMQNLINSIKKNFTINSQWEHSDDDSAVFPLDDNRYLVFTTDSFIVSPVFFKGGNIGDIAFAGTTNDLLMMGAEPLGLSMGLILEEGFSKEKLNQIMKTIGSLSKKTNIPIATGDTKVMDKGSVDKIIINTSGVGLVSKENLLTKEIVPGDKIIISGGIGEHAVALLSKRFDYETDIESDSQPLVDELKSVRTYIKQAKDPTRGGLAATLNEICMKNKVGISIVENKVPIKQNVSVVTEMLGLNPYELACEGRFICIASKENANKVESELKKFNSHASIIGEISEGNKVIIKTEFGERILHNPTGRIVPRIC